ncbi:zincin-like metallopeptidase toxin domain-containing protein, partial [Escherichia coli]
WDSRDQLTGYCSAQGELWEYRHDASGRRTEKRCDRKKIRFTYLWDGDRMEKLGIKVIRKADKYLPPNARAAFDYGLRNIYLRKNATLYEVYHEVIHAKQFAKIGREAYEALGRLSREEHVLNEILKSKNLFNEAEIAHAIKYVEGLREKFMMGLIN